MLYYLCSFVLSENGEFIVAGGAPFITGSSRLRLRGEAHSSDFTRKLFLHNPTALAYHLTQLGSPTGSIIWFMFSIGALSNPNQRKVTYLLDLASQIRKIDMLFQSPPESASLESA